MTVASFNHNRTTQGIPEMRSLLIGLAMLGVVWTSNMSRASSRAPNEAILLTGDPIPGESNPIIQAGAPVLNNSGDVAFRAVQRFADGPSLWSSVSGIHVVARYGATIPGASELIQIGASSIILADSGDVVFNAPLRGVPTSAEYGIFLERNGSLSTLAYEGMAAPGFPANAAFSNLTAFPIMNNAGDIVFAATAYGPDIDDDTINGVWRFSGGQLELILRGGGPAPGATGHASFDGFSPGAISENGGLTFSAGLQGASINNRNNSGFWTDRAGTLEIIAREGDAIPNHPGRVLTNVGPPSRIDGNSRLTFEAFRSGAGIDSSNSQCLFSDASGEIEPLVCTGDVLQGVGAESKIDELMFPSTFASNFGFGLNSHGIYAFGATLTGPSITTRNSHGIWSGAAGDWHLVARSGDVARPGTRDVFIEFANPNINERGQVAFRALVRGESSTARAGIWAEDSNGQLQLIALEGEQFEVRPGDFRTISSLDYFDGTQSSGEPAAINNLGQLAFALFFTDGSSGVFVSNVVAVPEPTALWLAGIGAMTIFVSVRCRRACR